MAKPIHHTASAAVAETAGSGVIRGVAGAIAGAALGTAIMAGAGVLAVGALGAIIPGSAITFASAVSTLGPVAALVGAIAAWTPFAPVGWACAAIGGGAGVVGGVIKKSEKIHDQEVAVQGLRNGHNVQLEAQMHEARTQAADQYTKLGYAQGLQDAQSAMMQQLQQAAMQQQMMQASAPEKSFVKAENERRGLDSDQVQLASHADKALASKEHSAEHSLSA